MSSPSPTFKRGCCPPCALKPDWSPVPADPRFSRNTPDQVLAHVVLNSTSRVIGDSELWAVQLLHARARTTPLQGPKRSKMIDLMKKIANVPEPCWDSSVESACAQLHHLAARGPCELSKEAEDGGAALAPPFGHLLSTCGCVEGRSVWLRGQNSCIMSHKRRDGTNGFAHGPVWSDFRQRGRCCAG